MPANLGARRIRSGKSLRTKILAHHAARPPAPGVKGGKIPSTRGDSWKKTQGGCVQ